MWLTIASEKKFREHLEQHPECKDKGGVVGIGRSIWDPAFKCAGTGEVRLVGVVYCEVHDKKPRMTNHGTPIYADKIFDAGEHVTDVERVEHESSHSQ